MELVFKLGIGINRQRRVILARTFLFQTSVTVILVYGYVATESPLKFLFSSICRGHECQLMIWSRPWQPPLSSLLTSAHNDPRKYIAVFIRRINS